MKQYDIYGIGAALVDTEIEVSEEDLKAFGIEKGVMTLVDSARQLELMDLLAGHLIHSKKASGGSAANSVIAASYFGSNNFYSCRVANDDNGQFYLADLSEAGIDYHNHNGSQIGTTGKCLVMITDDAERTMNTFLGISETLCDTDINEDALKSSKYAYIEGYLVTSETGKPAAIKVREIAQEAGVKVAFSLSDPAIVTYFHEGLCEMIGAGIDLLFCNQAEAMSFTKADSLSEACEKLKTISTCFAITLGADGALVFDGEELHIVDGHAATAVDTNGAGDMFAGAFLYGISNGMSFAKAGALGNLAASKVVAQYGPRLQAPQHADILSQAK